MRVVGRSLPHKIYELYGDKLESVRKSYYTFFYVYKDWKKISCYEHEWIPVKVYKAVRTSKCSYYCGFIPYYAYDKHITIIEKTDSDIDKCIKYKFNVPYLSTELPSI
jgi:hypothetical protein